MAIVYLGLGSNLGEKKQFLEQALTEIEKQIGHIVAQSAFYESTPWGYTSENNYMNACAGAETALSPMECLRVAERIERGLGRAKKTTDGYVDRVIDIDLLFYNQRVIETEELTLPHPHLQHRLFVLEPLAEIAPNFEHPILGKSIKTLLEEIISPS